MHCLAAAALLLMLHNLMHGPTSGHLHKFATLVYARLQQSVGGTRPYADRIHTDASAMQAVVEFPQEHWPEPLRAHRRC